MKRISAIVLTKNEELHLPGCLATLSWADEVLVVDSYSTDATQAVATAHNARFVQHTFVNFAAQRNYAQSIAENDWVLFVDADERVTPELRDEILTLLDSDVIGQFPVYHIPRCHLIFGRWFPDPTQRKLNDTVRRRIRSTEMVRLLDRRRAHWERDLHEEAVADGPHGILEHGVLLHYSNTNLYTRLEPLNLYTSLEAALLHKTRTGHVSFAEAALRALRHGVYVYFRYGWWRAGDIGLTMTAINMFSKFLDYTKLGERIRITSGQGIWTEQDRALLERFP